MPSKRPPIPVNIIAGPLGVGKTTVINHLLQQRPEREKWAVLVNEYGLIGLDAALMTKSTETGLPGVELKEVAGGCICCSAGFMFEVSLVLLLQRRPARLLIEPTGLAALSGILDTLDRPGIREAVDVRSVVCLLDPAQLSESLLREEVQDQVEAADVLLASRSDLADSGQLGAFAAWSSSLFPPKLHSGQLEHGRLPLSALDLVTNRQGAVSRGGHQHGTDHNQHHHHHSEHNAEPTANVCDAEQPVVLSEHRSENASTIGWVCWDGLVFDAERISCWIQQLAKRPGVRRTKAVMHTNNGWIAFNIADGVEEVRPSGYRRDSRIEIVIEGVEPPNATALEQELLGCAL